MARSELRRRRDRVLRVQRRIEWLEYLIATRKENDHNVAELSALEWLVTTADEVRWRSLFAEAPPAGAEPVLLLVKGGARVMGKLSDGVWVCACGCERPVGDVQAWCYPPSGLQWAALSREVDDAG